MMACLQGMAGTRAHHNFFPSITERCYVLPGSIACEGAPTPHLVVILHLVQELGPGLHGALRAGGWEGTAWARA